MDKSNIIITGTSSGLGLGLANYYIKKGFNVYGFSRNNSIELEKYSNYFHFKVDLTDNYATKLAFENILQTISNIDLLILNAGILGDIDIMSNTNMNNAKHVMDINLWANKRIIDLVLNSEMSCKQIVAISSGASQNGSAGWGAYSISKAALNMLIKTYAVENKDVHFSSIAPGLVDTAMQDYISNFKNEENFDAITRIQNARGTDAMPSANKIAEPLANMIDKLYSKETSGGYFDIRKY